MAEEVIQTYHKSYDPEYLKKVSRDRYKSKITNDPEFYEKEKQRIKEYKRNRYANDPEYAQKMKERAKENFRKKYAEDEEFRKKLIQRSSENYQRIKAKKKVTAPELGE